MHLKQGTEINKLNPSSKIALSVAIFLPKIYQINTYIFTIQNR